jgi:hypothetical protein
VLDDKAKSSIATLIKALTDRPALKLDIIGRADPQADGAGPHPAKEKAQAAHTQAQPTGRAAQALTKLAQARAQAVYEQILATARNLTDRVFILAPKTDAASDDGGPATRVDFALH